MIQHIRISNFAIIDNIEIDFHDGLNIITGETGAGKSIVIEAVSLALGSRADTAFVRSGQKKAIVQMIADHGGEEYVITREVSASGRNICRINGEIVTLAQLAGLCRKLADIHGQYDHQSLLDQENHIRLLDSYAADRIAPAADRVSGIYSEYAELGRRLQQLRRQKAEDMRQKDFMAFELEELTEAQLIPGEDESLEEAVHLMQHSEQIYEDLAGAYEACAESDYAILPAMKMVADRLQSAGAYSSELEELAGRIGDLYYEFEDACSRIRYHRDAVTFSPEELDRAIGRLDSLNRLKQKHGRTIEELIEYREELEQRLMEAADSDRLEEELADRIRKQEGLLAEASKELSRCRREAAAELEKKISDELSELNFGNGTFRIDFRNADQFGPNGTDIVEFLISTNRGEPLKPLAKIASGGEMSRIMLAFKKVIADYDGIPTMIFDEIDSGISGVAASVVGRKLMEIAAGHQIICITHLPQIAACGAHHYRIRKSSDDTTTYTMVDELNEQEKIEEIARLLGGANVTETTRASAEELIRASAGKGAAG